MLECIFDANDYRFKLVVCNCIYLNVSKVIWIDGDLIWCCWMQLFTFEGIEVICMTLRKLDSRLFNPNCTHGRILRSFELNTSWYDVVECNCAYLRVLRAFKLKRVYFKWVEGTKAYYSYWGLNWSELRIAMHIRNKEGLIWMCIGTFDLKLTWFEWSEGAKTIIIEEDVF